MRILALASLLLIGGCGGGGSEAPLHTASAVAANDGVARSAVAVVLPVSCRGVAHISLTQRYLASCNTVALRASFGTRLQDSSAKCQAENFSMDERVDAENVVITIRALADNGAPVDSLGMLTASAVYSCD